jgi:hypothetical protein
MIAMMFSLLLIGLLVQSIASALLKSIATSCDMDITTQNPAELRRKQRRRKQRKHTKQQPEKIIWNIKLEIEEMRRCGKYSLFSLLSNRYSGHIEGYVHFIPWFYRLNINCDLVKMYFTDRNLNTPPMPEGYVYLIFDDLCMVVAVTPEYFNNHDYLRNISSSTWKGSGNYFPAIGIGKMRYPTICIMNSEGFLPKSDSLETLRMMLQKKLST